MNLTISIMVDKFVSFRGHVKRGRWGGMYNDAEYTAYHDAITNAFIGSEVVPEIASDTHPFKLKVRFEYPFPKSKPAKDGEYIRYKITTPDLDNIGKAVKDALEGLVYKNDGQVVDLHYQKYYTTEGIPRLEIEIERIEWRPKE